MTSRDPFQPKLLYDAMIFRKEEFRLFSQWNFNSENISNFHSLSLCHLKIHFYNGITGSDIFIAWQNIHKGCKIL